MSTGRKHFLIRSFTTELPYNADEESYGTVLMALPEDTQITIHDVNTIGNTRFAEISVITTQEVSEEELAQLIGELGMEAPEAPTEDTPKDKGEVMEATVLELPKKPRKKRSGPPPTSG